MVVKGRIARWAWVGLGLLVVGWLASQASAQTPRPLAPGVLTVIPPDVQTSETFTGPVALPELTSMLADLDWTPNYLPPTETLLNRARAVRMRRPVWNLEFSFKPLRMIEVDLPEPSGKLRRKLVWYMVYRIRYFGQDVKPTPTTDSFGNTTFPSSTRVASNPTPRFFPHFVLDCPDLKKSYLDQVLPAAKEAILLRERPGVPLYDSVEMTNVPIPVAADENAPGVWGYVTWIDVDPRTDFFSIYVKGLTNAYQFQDQQGAFKPGDPPLTGRTFKFKTLQLNFWRPGDSVFQHEEEIHFGVPIETSPEDQAAVLKHYGLSKRLDYLWVYR